MKRRKKVKENETVSVEIYQRMKEKGNEKKGGGK